MGGSRSTQYTLPKGDYLTTDAPLRKVKSSLSRRVKPMPDRDLPRDRKFVTFRLLPEDRELLQHVGRGRPDIPDRHAAFLALAEIVRRQEYPEEQPEPERR